MLVRVDSTDTRFLQRLRLTIHPGRRIPIRKKCLKYCKGSSYKLIKWNNFVYQEDQLPVIYLIVPQSQVTAVRHEKSQHQIQMVHILVYFILLDFFMISTFIGAPRHSSWVWKKCPLHCTLSKWEKVQILQSYSSCEWNWNHVQTYAFKSSYKDPQNLSKYFTISKGKW
jgi:hypothetical protein